MAFRDFANPPTLDSQGKTTNPADGAVLADTGVLVNSNNQRSKLFEVRVIVGNSAAGLYQIQHRNAANGANVAPSPFTVYVAAGQTCEVVLTIPIAPGERVRVTSDGGLTGTVAATIQAEALS